MFPTLSLDSRNVYAIIRLYSRSSSYRISNNFLYIFYWKNSDSALSY